jgi:hypothetical protein
VRARAAIARARAARRGTRTSRRTPRWDRQPTDPNAHTLLFLTRARPLLMALRSDVHVIRNAGGRASEAVRSLAISQQLLGTREVRFASAFCVL